MSWSTGTGGDIGLTRLCIISDTHLPRGSRRLPAACTAALERADLVLHAGDFTAHGVLEDLRRLGPVAGVRGNMDDGRLRALLRERRTVEVAGLRLGMVHDAGPRVGRERRLVSAFPGCEAVVYGHTHEPQVKRFEGVWILNPGSPTERRRAPTRSFLVVDVVDGLFQPRLVELA